jgi:hypothetical protein
MHIDAWIDACMPTTIAAHLLHVVAATVATTAIAALVAAVLLPHATTRVASWTAMLPTARIMVPALGVSWVAAPVAAVVAALCGTATLAGIHVRVLIVLRQGQSGCGEMRTTCTGTGGWGTSHQPAAMEEE